MRFGFKIRNGESSFEDYKTIRNAEGINAGNKASTSASVRLEQHLLCSNKRYSRAGRLESTRSFLGGMFIWMFCSGIFEAMSNEGLAILASSATVQEQASVLGRLVADGRREMLFTLGLYFIGAVILSCHRPLLDGEGLGTSSGCLCPDCVCSLSSSTTMRPPRPEANPRSCRL